MLRPDPVQNVVQRLKQLGFKPRRVAEDCWVARCPLCGEERALTVGRASLVVCRNPNCKDYRILQTIGLPGRDAYNPARALEESPVVTAVKAVLERHPALHCSPTDLLRILNDFKPQRATTAKGWPKTHWALSRALRRLAPQLRGISIGVDFATTVEHRGRIITLVRPET
jgi:hypothetical protein